MQKNNYATTILNRVLLERQKRNSQYSMRSYAKQLDLNPASLSSILKGKRKLPIENIERIAGKLKLSPKEYGLFVTSALDGRVNPKDINLENHTFNREVINEKLHHKIIAEWEYYAFLSLINLDNYQNDLKWIAKKLQISQKRAREVICGLIEAKFIALDENGRHIRTKTRYNTSDDIINQALIESHQESLQIAQKKLTSIEPLLRDFCSLTFTGNISKMAKAKALIREFRENIDELFSDEQEEANDIFQLNIQLYPLTQLDE